MSALSQAKTWALREAWRDFKTSDWGMLAYVRTKVVKVELANIVALWNHVGTTQEPHQFSLFY